MPKEVALLSVLFSLWIAGFLCEIMKRTLALGIYIVEVLVINCSTSPFFFKYLYSGTVRSYALHLNSVHLFNYISGQGQLYLTKCCSVRSAVFGTAVLSVSTSDSTEVWAVVDLHPSATHYATMTAKLLFNGNL